MSRARLFGPCLLLAAASLVTTACESSRYGHVELYRVGGHPEAEIAPSGLSLPEGGVLVFEAQPRADAASPEYVGLERFKLRPSDPDVAMAHRAILRDTWVVSGMSVGETRLQVLVDGEVVDDVPVEVFLAAPEEDEG
jgi:hypothetical protein